MRFLADMGVSLSIVEWLRSEGHMAVLANCSTDFEAGAVVLVEESRLRVRRVPSE